MHSDSKKRITAQLISCILIAAMLLSGCGAGSTAKTDTAPAGSESNAQPTEDENYEYDHEIKISIALEDFVLDGMNLWSDKPIDTMYEKYDCEPTMLHDDFYHGGNHSQERDYNVSSRWYPAKPEREVSLNIKTSTDILYTISFEEDADYLSIEENNPVLGDFPEDCPITYSAPIRTGMSLDEALEALGVKDYVDITEESQFEFKSNQGYGTCAFQIGEDRVYLYLGFYKNGEYDRLIEVHADKENEKIYYVSVQRTYESEMKADDTLSSEIKASFRIEDFEFDGVSIADLNPIETIWEKRNLHPTEAFDGGLQGSTWDYDQGYGLYSYSEPDRDSKSIQLMAEVNDYDYYTLQISEREGRVEIYEDNMSLADYPINTNIVYRAPIRTGMSYDDCLKRLGLTEIMKTVKPNENGLFFDVESNLGSMRCMEAKTTSGKHLDVELEKNYDCYAEIDIYIDGATDRASSVMVTFYSDTEAGKAYQTEYLEAARIEAEENAVSDQVFNYVNECLYSNRIDELNAKIDAVIAENDPEMLEAYYEALGTMSTIAFISPSIPFDYMTLIDMFNRVEAAVKPEANADAPAEKTAVHDYATAERFRAILDREMDTVLSIFHADDETINYIKTASAEEIMYGGMDNYFDVEMSAAEDTVYFIC